MTRGESPQPSGGENLKRAAIKTGKVLGKAAKDFGHWTGLRAYELGPMRIHTSESPVWEPGMSLRERERQGSFAINLPFILDSKFVPAVRNKAIFKHYNPDFPQLTLRLEDTHHKISGDEVIMLEAQGSARKPMQSTIAWRLYHLGSDSVDIYGGKSPIRVSQAEMTAADLSQMLIDSTIARSGEKIKLRHSDIIQALNMLAEYSPAVQKRWELLKERGKFSAHLAERPELVTIILKSIISVPNEQFKAFLRHLDSPGNQITGWSAFNAAINQIPGHVGSGLPLLAYSPLQVIPDQDFDENIKAIPTSALTSMLGLSFFNTLLDGYVAVVIPRIKEVAESMISAQDKGIQYGKELVKIRERAYAVAISQLKKKSPAVISKTRSMVDEVMKNMEHELRYVLTAPNRPPAVS